MEGISNQNAYKIKIAHFVFFCFQNKVHLNSKTHFFTH